jgi:hypothetical protein
LIFWPRYRAQPIEDLLFAPDTLLARMFHEFAR